MGEPEKLIKRALTLDPNQPKALALAGTIAFQKKDFSAAARDWERALSVLPEDSGFARQIAAGLAEAREALGLTQPKGVGASPAPAKATASRAAVTGPAVSGTITITSDLAKRTSPDDTLFVFARPPEGAGPPLAVIRTRAGELPLKFSLDDSMAMNPNSKLSSAALVVITARIAKSGGVVPQPGDLEGVSKPVAPGASGVAVLIDKAR
jgi:cytochrome c-type biogenesis protein CcmH